MKRIISLMLALLLLFGMAACAAKPGTEEPSAPSKDPVDTPPASDAPAADEGEAVTWDVLTNVDADFPFEQYVADEKAKWHLGREAELDWYFNYGHHYATKPWTEYTALNTAYEITGINVTGDIPTGDPSERVRLMMATNTLPDLITLGFGDPLASELIEGGYVWDLDELMDEYCPEFKDEVPKTLRVIGTYEEYDNKFYSLTGVSNSDAVFETYMADPTNQAELNIIVGNFSYSVRKDIWEEMGEPSIATPDDLYNVLKQFKEKYPTLNGKTSIGISGYATGSTTDYLTSSGLLKTMGYSFGIMDYYLPGDGTCTTKYLNPNYPEFIAYMNKLYTEGLIDPEVFVKDDQQVVEDLSTCSFMMPYVWHAADPANNLLDAVDPNSHFISIPPMAAEGEEFAFPVSRVGGAVMTFVSKSTDDPEACIKLLRYGFSPTGTLQTSKGNPGEHYWVQDGILTNSPEVVEAYKVDAAGYNNEAGLWDYYSMWYPPIFEKRTDSADRVKYDYPNSLPFAFDGTATAYKMDPSTTSDEGIAKATIENIIKRSEAAAITAATPEESAAIIEAMIQEIVATKDFDKLESYWTARYQKNLELFGEPWF